MIASRWNVLSQRNNSVSLELPVSPLIPCFTCTLPVNFFILKFIMCLTIKISNLTERASGRPLWRGHFKHRISFADMFSWWQRVDTYNMPIPHKCPLCWHMKFIICQLSDNKVLMIFSVFDIIVDIHILHIWYLINHIYVYLEQRQGTYLFYIIGNNFCITDANIDLPKPLLK